MSFKEIQEKAINGLKNKSSTVTTNYNFTDELGLKYKYGEINLIELISQMTEDLSYTLVETFDNNFFICDKKTNFSFTSYINPINSEKIWEDDIEIKFIKAYPELFTIYKNNKLEIQSASCKGCAKNGKFYQLMNELMFLDNTNRDNSFFIDLYGQRFYDVLLRHKKVQRPQQTQQPQPSQNKNTTSDFKKKMIMQLKNIQEQLNQIQITVDQYI